MEQALAEAEVEAAKREELLKTLPKAASIKVAVNVELANALKKQMQELVAGMKVAPVPGSDLQARLRELMAQYAQHAPSGVSQIGAGGGIIQKTSGVNPIQALNLEGFHKTLKNSIEQGGKSRQKGSASVISFAG
jgi:hypothetical protein